MARRRRYDDALSGSFSAFRSCGRGLGGIRRSNYGNAFPRFPRGLPRVMSGRAVRHVAV